MIAALGMAARAQTINYPHKKLIESGDYSQAEQLIMAELAQDPNSCAANYSAFELYFSQGFGGYNYLKAYGYLLKSKEAYSKSKDKSKLMKMQITTANINKQIVKVAEIGLQEALQANTLAAYEDFLQRYEFASAKQKKTVQDKLAVAKYQNSPIKNWDTLKDAASKYYDNLDLVLAIQDSMYSHLKRDPRIDRIKYAFTSFKRPELKDSLILLLHKVHEDAKVLDYTEFWKVYGGSKFPELKQKDLLIQETFKSNYKLKHALDAAPYRVGYDALLDLLKGRINSKDWEGATHKLNAFADYYGGDPRFESLKEMINKPLDESIVIKEAGPNTKLNIIKRSCDTTIASDGSAMIFVSRIKNSNEVKPSANLFVSLRQKNGLWGKPIELGYMVNSSGDEYTPFLHPDMTSLYFCSNGHNNIGGTDIFMVRRTDPTSWTSWSKPVNLGKEINTGSNESDFRISNDGSVAYFCRTEGESQKWYYVELPQWMRPNAIATINGTVTETSTGKPVITKISFENLELHAQIGSVETDPSGKFTILLPEDRIYGFFVDDDRYYPTAGNLDIRDKDEMLNFRLDLKVEKMQELVEKHTPIILNNLFFNQGEAVVLPPSVTELERLYNAAKPQRLKIEISGHTDDTGDDNVNQKLSEERALAVKKHLVGLGYEESLIKTIGYGKKKPIASNSTPEGRQKNRRVEIRLAE